MKAFSFQPFVIKKKQSENKRLSYSVNFCVSSWLAYSPGGFGNIITLEFCNEITEDAEYRPILLPENV
jgi:hypothetical protein